jgi:hypothetical protein
MYRFIAVAVLVAMLVVTGTGLVQAGDEAPTVWDNSSIKLAGSCLPSGEASFVVENVGADMQGTSTWREYESGVLAQSGTFQLYSGGVQTWTFVSNGVPVRFEVDQRPEHPGNSHPKLELPCPKPTAVTVRNFTASTQQTKCRVGYVVDRTRVMNTNWWVISVGYRPGGPSFASTLSLFKYAFGTRALVCNGNVYLP